jgi:Flp pilus assembly protein TadD
VSIVRRFARLACVVGALAFCLQTGGCGGESTAKSRKTHLAVTLDPPPEPTAPAFSTRRPPGTLSFTKDIAPVLFSKCAGCHHPGEIGPFPLLGYDDVKKRARQIVEVIQKRIMPPWSPLPGYCEFEGDRSLSADEIGMIAQWVDEGASEGNASDLPQLPEFPHGWKNGKPDLVVTMSEPFRVPAESTADVYRKFVLRVPVEETKYVRAFDFNPGNERVVHHMRLRVDRTGLSRAQDEADSVPGFDGTMFSGDTEPDGFFLVWTPGYEAIPKHADVAWKLQKGTDLVLELHLHPTGKDETVQPSIGLYFQPAPPRQRLFMVQLSCETIDIPPAKNDERYSDEYVLPVDMTLLAAMPHAHYLATHFRSWAVLPGGEKRWLMRIADWDFNWQREYTYAKPIWLPKGTTLCMEVTYDNSAKNPRNPHNPPQRVVIGRDTFNEMAQVFFQVLAANPEDEELLLADYRRKEFHNNLLRERFLVERGQGTSEVHFNLACLYVMSGDFSMALQQYQESIRLKPENVFAINNLGGVYRKLGRLDEAIRQYQRALEINPRDARVHNNLGLVFLDQGRNEKAAREFEAALQISPELAEPRANLGVVAVQQKNLPLAESHFQRALEANPELDWVRTNLQSVRARLAGPR